MRDKNSQKNALGACRRIPTSARERAIFSPGKDGEGGDVGFIVDAAGRSQAEKGPLEARSNCLTGSLAPGPGYSEVNATVAIPRCYPPDPPCRLG